MRPGGIHRWLAVAALAAVVCLFAAACGGGSSGTATSGPATSSGTASTRPAATPTPTSVASVSPGPTSTVAPAPRQSPAQIISRLTPRELAGQRVIYSYHGLIPPASLLSRIRAGEVAGVVFFAGNIASRAQIRSVIAELQQAAARSPVKLPLLLMTDQEGGVVRRLPGSPLLSEREIGQSGDPAVQARLAGQGAGLNLKGVGMNVNLAPVLDVYRSAGDFIDRFGRSYSMHPSLVAGLGAEFVTAQQQAGVAATAKHFPGLGAATRLQDTDVRPVTLRVPLTTLRSVDERPFTAAIAAGVRLVMVSWATYPALDATRPAGLSRVVVEQELRGRLGFKGVTITDSLGAKALSAFGGTPQRAVLAAGADMDLLLCASKSAAQGAKATDALESALTSGGLETASFKAAVERVVALRSSLVAPAPASLSAGDLNGISSTINAYFAAINDKDFVTAWRQFTPSLRQSVSVSHLASTDSTTHDDGVTIHQVTPLDARTAVAYVTFTSTQAASQGPNGDTRDDWTLDYTMRLVDGRWLIDGVTGHNGSTHRPA